VTNHRRQVARIERTLKTRSSESYRVFRVSERAVSPRPRGGPFNYPTLNSLSG